MVRIHVLSHVGCPIKRGRAIDRSHVPKLKA